MFEGLSIIIILVCSLCCRFKLDVLLSIVRDMIRALEYVNEQFLLACK